MRGQEKPQWLQKEENIRCKADVLHYFGSCWNSYWNVMVKLNVFLCKSLFEWFSVNNSDLYLTPIKNIHLWGNKPRHIFIHFTFCWWKSCSRKYCWILHTEPLWIILKIHWAHKPPCLWTFNYLYNNSFCTVLLEQRGFLSGLFCKGHLATFVFLCQSC